MDPDEMRQRASRYRDIARRITDDRTIKALNDLADKYEALAGSHGHHQGRKIEDERKDCDPST